MATAKVTLQDAGTFKAPGGLQWRKGQTRTFSGESLEYYRHQSEFRIVEERSEAKAAPAAPSVQAPMESPPPPPPAPLPAAEPETTPATTDDATTFSEAELRSLSKAELIDLGSDGLGLTLAKKQTKDEMVAAILEAQG